MNGYEHILAKQTAWARNRDVDLIGSKRDHGRLAYTPDLDHNLFQPLLPEVRTSFSKGDGGELGHSDAPGKMQAVHSSSALAVNVFQYWKSISDASTIASMCEFCRPGSEISCDIQFEEKYPINDSFGRHPNIDAVIHNNPTARTKRFAIECKFSEAYGAREHNGFKQAYPDHG